MNQMEQYQNSSSPVPLLLADKSDYHESTESLDNREKNSTSGESSPVETAVPSGLPKPKRYKYEINFTYPSFKRRNIDKSLVRSISALKKRAESVILTDFAGLKITPTKYQEINKALKEMSEIEKKDDSKKDYAAILNCMICNLPYRIILKRCLQLKITEINDHMSRRVKTTNRAMYLATLDDYLRYINSL